LPKDEGWRSDIKLFIGCSGVRLHMVGIGNPMRRDDGVGPEVASSVRRLLRGRRPSWVSLHPPSVRPESLLPRIPPGQRVMIFDAVEADREPGAVVCARLGDTRYGFFATHNVPLKLVPGLAGREDEVFLVGIQPASVEFGEGLTPSVRGSAEALSEEVANLVVSEDG
jgi:hydrogenase maturation protease